MRHLSRFVIAFIACLPALLLFVSVLWREVLPTGIFSVTWTPGTRSVFVSGPLPDVRTNRESVDGRSVERVVSEPIWWFLRPHRGFENVRAELRFQPNDAPILETGALAQAPDIYHLVPVYHKTLQALATTWKQTPLSDTRVLWTPPETSFADPLTWLNTQDRSKVAIYHTTLPAPLRLSDYQATSRVQSFSTALQGGFTLKTYVKNETLIWNFEGEIDRALEPVSQTLPTLFVWNEQDELVSSVQPRLDGLNWKMTLTVPALPEGVYRLEWRASDGWITSRTLTHQSRFVFLHRLDLLREPNSVVLKVGKGRMGVQTDQADGVQSLRAGEQTIDIVEPFARYEIVLNDERTQLTVPSGRLLIDSEGPIALTEASFFVPDPPRLTPEIDPTGLVGLVSTPYEPAHCDDAGWCTAHADVPTALITLSKERTWKWVLSVPGVGRTDGVHLSHVTWTFVRAPFSVRELVMFLWNR